MSERETADGHSREEMRNLLSKNFLVQVVAKLFYLVTRVGLPPIILSFVTLEQYGIWSTCFILIGYLGMSTFGISGVYVRYVAEYHARGESERISRLLSTGLTVTTALSALLLVGLWFVLPGILVLLNVPEVLRDQGFILLYATAATFMLDMTFGAFANVLHGLQRVAQQTMVWVASFCLEAVLIVVLLLQGLGLYALLLAFAARYVLSTIAQVILCFRALPGLQLSLRLFDRECLRLFYGYGVMVQVAGLLSMFLYSVEKVIAGAFVGVEATGLFDIGEKLPVMASQITASMTATFIPAIPYLLSLGQDEQIRRLYLKGSRYMNILSGVILGFMCAFAAPLLTLWLGPGDQYRVAPLIMALFAVPYQLHELTGPASAYHRATRARRELVFQLTQLAMVVAGVCLGFFFYGQTVLVIAGAVAGAMSLSALVYILYSNRFLALPLGAYLGKVLIPGAFPYVVAFGVARVTAPFFAQAGAGRGALAASLGLSGALYLLVTGPCLYWLMCDAGERSYLRLQLAHTFGGFWRALRGRE